MITLCWSAKGGSGTTVFVATLALVSPRRTLLVDLAGDLPATLGLPEPAHPGVAEWLASDAEPDRLEDLLTRVTPAVDILHHRRGVGADPAMVAPPEQRWTDLGAWLAHRSAADDSDVIIDAGTGEPPAALAQTADRSYLVTRPCYLSLRRAARQIVRPTGVVVVDEPGRSFRMRDIESAIGVPVISRVDLDPALARAVDAGLLSRRLPVGVRRAARKAAA